MDGVARDGSLLVDQVHEHEGEAPRRVEVLALVCGNGLVVTIQGGTHRHVGAVALAIPRPSLDDPARRSASASVLCVVGHKEDLLARAVALDLASALGVPVSVTAGLHLDNATAAEIDTLVAICERACGRLKARLLQRLSSSSDSARPS